MTPDPQATSLYTDEQSVAETAKDVKPVPGKSARSANASSAINKKSLIG